MIDLTPLDLIRFKKYIKLFSIRFGQELRNRFFIPIQENTNLPRYAKEFTQEEIRLISDYEISADRKSVV